MRRSRSGISSDLRIMLNIGFPQCRGRRSQECYYVRIIAQRRAREVSSMHITIIIAARCILILVSQAIRILCAYAGRAQIQEGGVRKTLSTLLLIKSCQLQLRVQSSQCLEDGGRSYCCVTIPRYKWRLFDDGQKWRFAPLHKPPTPPHYGLVVSLHGNSCINKKNNLTFFFSL